MTKKTNARIAGAAFLLYIAVGVGQMVISRATGGAEPRINLVLGLVCAMFAFALGVTLNALTRDEDRDIAALGMVMRSAEGVTILVPTLATLCLMQLAGEQNTAASAQLSGLLSSIKGWNVSIAAWFFAVGSTLFCWLFWRGRLIPQVLALLGLVASVILVVALPLRLTEVISGSTLGWLWIPMALFEIPFGVWLIVKGVREV